MTFDQPLGLTATHGEEGRWHMGSVQRLPPSQQCNSTGHLSNVEHAKYLKTTGSDKIIHQWGNILM
jgi:hypothetical protein